MFNEVSTFPGSTAASQYPRMFAAAGLTYPRLLDTLVDTALTRPVRPDHTPTASASHPVTIPRSRRAADAERLGSDDRGEERDRVVAGPGPS